MLVHEGEPIDLLDRWEGAGEVIVVDAVRSGAPAGTVHRLDRAGRADPAALRGSTHAFGLAETIELARALDRLPQRLTVYDPLRERLRRRMHLVRMRASAMNRIFGLLTQWGLRLSLRAAARARTR